MLQPGRTAFRPHPVILWEAPTHFMAMLSLPSNCHPCSKPSAPFTHCLVTTSREQLQLAPVRDGDTVNAW